MTRSDSFGGDAGDFAWEQQEFERWDELAESFGLVEDWYWDVLQYWVSRGEQVWPFAELSGTFPVGWLRKQVTREE